MSQPLALCLAPKRSRAKVASVAASQAGVVMDQFDETGRNHVVAPGVEVEGAGVTTVA